MMQAQKGATVAQDEENGKPLPERRSIVDSAYRSLSTLSGNFTGPAWRISGDRPAVTPTIGQNLLYFDLDPQPGELNHYNDIRPRLRGRIAKIAKERHAKSCGMQAMMFGEAEAEAKLHVVVFCSPLMESAFNEMFASSLVQKLLELPFSDRSLGFLVIPEPPSPAAAHADIDVCCQTSYASKYHTYCGAPAIFKARGRNIDYYDAARQGTIGGIIQVSYPNGELHFYGMTAGHVSSPLHREGQVRPDEDYTAQAKSSQETSVWISDNKVLGPLMETSLLPEIFAGRAEATHDWALFDVDILQPNRAISAQIASNTETAGSHPILMAATPNAFAAIPDPVVMLGGSTGPRHGEFSKLPAEIWLEHSGCFVDAYLMKMTDSKVTQGDSGAWVVHVANSELYGHVVATNVFDQVYVIPVLETFENMRACLGAVSVGLPDARGLMRASESAKSDVVKVNNKSTYRKGKRSTRPTHKAYQGKRIKQGRSLDWSKVNKTWGPLFQTNRPSFDQPYVESLMQRGQKLHLLSNLLGEPSPDISRHEIQQVKAYFDSQSRLLHTRAWLSYEPSISTHDFERVTAKDLSLRLIASYDSRYQHEGQCKAITMINPDSTYLLALIETVGYNQARALRDLLVNHITSRVDINIYIRGTKNMTFELNFHIPYYTLRPTTASSSYESLASSLHRAQVSVTVAGNSDTAWISYCLIHVYDGEGDLRTEDFSSDSGYHEDYDWPNCDVDSEDVSDVETMDQGYRNPRKYWLGVVKSHLRSIVEEWRHIVCTLGGLYQDEFTFTSRHELEQMGILLCLLSTLRANLSSTTRAWTQFHDIGGNSAYLSDILDARTQDTLASIKESFDKLLNLEEELHRIDEACHRRYKIISRAKLHTMTEESNRLSEKSNRSSLRSVELTVETNQLNLKMAEVNRDVLEFARTSTDAAVQSSRTLRLNVQLFLIITPLVLALQYFGAEQDILKFERSPRTFAITVCILFCVFPVLAYGLVLIHYFWDGFNARRKLRYNFSEKTDLL
ncbi:hypothetical protein E8E13_002285 [Curvularia kusanoi]|uniref:Uncharacterized protein n=1 Tax=Curvularia kusanoi TaxID=90978 RepID=A0A9P4TB44_CURKU|nr:hypothetical protein E8E13_002285 [Curvularia kusanoi]